MQVETGTYPQHVDKDVRFRTTYYFRVFDYCWNKYSGQQATIPQTDTLYRYRMTGKAHSLLSQVKFESGVLDAADIDPFGTDVVYDSNITGFRVRTAEEARQESREAEDARGAEKTDAAREAARAGAWARYIMLRAEYDKVAKTATPEVKTGLQSAMDAALKDFNAVSDPEIEKKIEQARQATNEQIKKLEGQIDELRKQIAARTEQPELADQLLKLQRDMEAQVNKLRQDLDKLSASGAATDALCPEDKPTRRRGFQVMGPEGWRTFDQDKRLLMAMSSSAKPLIETLNEYSGRILNSRVNPAEALLPLVRENLVTLEAQQAADRLDPTTKTVDEIYAAALGAFTEE